MKKKEMIEELRQIMCSEDCEECAKETADYHGITLEQARNQGCIICEYAKVLYNDGYRKIPEGSVVLSKEEYEKLKSLFDCGTGYMSSQIGGLPLTVEGLRKAVDEITRLNRVEAELQNLNVKYYNEAKDLRRELKQTRKKTAKEIYQWLKEHTFDDSFEIIKTYFKEEFGVEVENDVRTILER